MSTVGIPGQRMSVVFYPGRRGVRVTDTRFSANGRSFPIDELADVEWCRGDPQVARRVAIRIVGLEALLAAGVAAVAPSLIAALVMAGYTVIAGISVWASVHRWPTPMELWASYRGRRTVLYVCMDHTEFGQIRRALIRAIELHRDRHAI